MATVTIDSTWLTTNGPAPYVLSADNTLYDLQADVAVTDADLSGEIFLLTGKNVLLRLNGHTIHLNGKAIPQNLDSELYRRTSEYTYRADNADSIHNFGGTYYDGLNHYSVIDPARPEYPPLVPWARTK